MSKQDWQKEEISTNNSCNWKFSRFNVKYVDPGIPMVTITINKFSISKTLIDLGEAINVMTLKQ